MVTKTLRLTLALVVLIATGLMLAGAAVAEDATVKGVITEEGAIQTDEGEVIEVADTPAGNEMLEHVGKTVEAVGTITEEDGVKYISVTSYNVME